MNTTSPVKVTPKQRIRGRKRKDGSLNLPKNAIDRLLNLARAVGDKEAITYLMPQKSMTDAKKELMQSIRNNQVEEEKWLSYKESATAFNERQKWANTDN